MVNLQLQIKAGFASVDVRFKKQDTKFEAIQTQLTKMMVIFEDQADPTTV
ncbi:MAG: hypothetical protein H6623_05455 [Bdellovibrionaceae bacterium]|nr:hypothetical protein [Pseudobdellovibrionaceae bacterium]